MASRDLDRERWDEAFDAARAGDLAAQAVEDARLANLANRRLRFCEACHAELLPGEGFVCRVCEPSFQPPPEVA